MDKERIKLETRICKVQDDSGGWAEVAVKAMNEVKELKNLIKELKVDIVEKDTHLDHLQKRNDGLSTLLENAKKDIIEEFRSSSQFTGLLDSNYIVGFEDFRMDVIERFLEVDFSSIKLNLGAASSLLQMSSKDVNIEDDATIQPA